MITTSDIERNRNAIEVSGLKPNFYHKIIMEATEVDFPTAMALKETYMTHIDYSEASMDTLIREARIANRLYRMGAIGVWD